MRTLIEPHEYVQGEAPSRFEFFRPLEGSERLGSPFPVIAKVGDFTLQKGAPETRDSSPGVGPEAIICALLRNLRARTDRTEEDTHALAHLEQALKCYKGRLPRLVEWPEGFRKGDPVYVPF